ncbi:MAG: RNA-binding protein [Halodesulfurarchaeum sp.]
MQVSSRHHLREDDVDAIRESLADIVGVEFDASTFELVEFDDEEFDIVLVDGEPLVWYPEDEPFLTVVGANALDPMKRLVEVDSGAVSFVSDGADVMRPGITDADQTIESGDLVIVVEEAHGKALAIGRAMTDGPDMIGESGKVVRSLHHVGDDLFSFST